MWYVADGYASTQTIPPLIWLKHNENAQQGYSAINTTSANNRSAIKPSREVKHPAKARKPILKQLIQQVIKHSDVGVPVIKQVKIHTPFLDQTIPTAVGRGRGGSGVEARLERMRPDVGDEQDNAVKRKHTNTRTARPHTLRHRLPATTILNATPTTHTSAEVPGDIDVAIAPMTWAAPAQESPSRATFNVRWTQASVGDGLPR